MTPPRLLALLAAGLGLIAPRSARADEPKPSCQDEHDAVIAEKPLDAALTAPTDPRAAEHVKLGNRQHRTSQYVAAITSYEAAGLLSDAPVILFNLGQAYRENRQYETAIRQYRLFLDRARPGAKVRALVECHIRSMTAELEGAAASAPPTGPAPDSSDDASSAVGPVDADAMPDATAGSLPAPWYADSIGWGAVGIGTVGAALGGVLLLDAASLDDEADREDRQELRHQLYADADDRRMWGTIVTAAGAATLAIGVVKLALTPGAARARHEERSAQLVIGPGQIGLAGRW